ncbi:hypothetical protein ACFO3D_16650 [Virgibacillus kekensis]|uniref:Uncharacterized protein n=1 Tax=Virgibacillus kekensis TaxID=202261 RepID=A0ABV9DLU9_9BACI
MLPKEEKSKKKENFFRLSDEDRLELELEEKEKKEKEVTTEKIFNKMTQKYTE